MGSTCRKKERKQINMFHHAMIVNFNYFSSNSFIRNKKTPARDSLRYNIFSYHFLILNPTSNNNGKNLENIEKTCVRTICICYYNEISVVQYNTIQCNQ